MKELNPTESAALTIGLAQVMRGEEPMPNVASVCILALARLTERHDWTEESLTLANESAK